MEQVAIEVADGTIRQHDVITAAPVVFAAAVDGDDVAVAIVHRLADEVVEFAQAAVNRLGLTDIDVPVVLGGGTLQHGPRLLLDRITGQLPGRCRARSRGCSTSPRWPARCCRRCPPPAPATTSWLAPAPH